MLRKSRVLLLAVMILALILGTYGCGGDKEGDGETTPTGTITDTMTATPPAKAIKLKVAFSESAEVRPDIVKFVELVEQPFEVIANRYVAVDQILVEVREDCLRNSSIRGEMEENCAAAQEWLIIPSK